MFSKIWEFVDGYKTQIVAVFVGVGAALTMAGIDIPEYIWPLLGALGLGAIRDAVRKLEGE